MKDKDKAEDIEVKDPIEVKPKKRKQVKKWTFNENVGTRDGKPRYEKGQSYELTKKQIDNYKKHNLICQI